MTQKKKQKKQKTQKKLQEKESQGGENNMNRSRMLQGPVSHHQAKSVQVGLHWGILMGFWSQRVESRGQAVRMACSVALFPS